MFYQFSFLRGGHGSGGPDSFRVTGRASRGLFLSGRMGHGVIVGVVPSRTIWLFANITKTVAPATAVLSGGQV